MKKFWKTVLAVVVGLLIANIIGFMFFMGFFSSLSSGESKPVIPSKGVMVIDMATTVISEQSAEITDPVALIQGASGSSIGIWDAIQALEKAAMDPAVQFIFLKTDGMSGDLALTQEFRHALSDFRKSGKPVVSFSEMPTTGSYYLASAADKVYMGSYEGGTVQMTGISSQLIFLKDLLDKLGVNVQLIRHGKYKSAGEMYIKNHASPENMEQNQVMINSVWSSYASEIAESRDMTVDQVNAAIDELKLNFPADFLNLGFADALYTKEQLKDQLTSLAVADKFEDIHFFSFSDYAAAKVAPGKGKSKIAVIYANGEILDGWDSADVTGDRFAKMISGIRKDESVKAVLLRVNSPGGSVVASDKIKTELDLLKAEKPLVASYGGYAASGGYWISNNCEKIFSDPVTLTGSIGVFGMVPDLSKTLSDIAHVNITAVSSNKHGDMFSMMRPFTPEEMDYMQASIENIYTKFVSIVAEGRNLDPDFVDSIAQGRVWTGADALKIGLVDELGGFKAALEYTAGLAGNPDLSSWNVVGYPKMPTTMESLMAMFSGQGGPDMDQLIFTGTPLEGAASAMTNWYKSLQNGNRDFIFARMPYIQTIQ